MTIIYMFFAVLGCVIVLRSVLLLIFAELGRKHDLIKHIYKSGTDFQIAIVIPFIDSRKIKPLEDLIEALVQQDYPLQRLGINIVGTEDTIMGLPNQDDLHPNVKAWTYPARFANKGQCMSWLIERLLAAGGPSKLFVFLDADDIVRPDFLRNVTTRAFDCFAMQGYIALKRPPKGIVANIVTLSTRLINRIENAGRFHMGLSCKLSSSGWVVRQEILEMLPFKQGNDIECLEYATLLNLNGYRINWAPNVVVYKDEKINFIVLLKEIAHTTINRVKLSFQYGLQLLFQGFARLDLNLFDQAWCLIKPPNFVVGFLGLTGAFLLLLYPFFPNSFYYWSILVLGFWSTQLISLAVARCSFKDVASFIFLTPLVYSAGLVLFPVFLSAAIGEALFQFNSRPEKVRIGKRFDESQPSTNLTDMEKKVKKGNKKKKDLDRILPSINTADIFDFDKTDEEIFSDNSGYVTLKTEEMLSSYDVEEQRIVKNFASIYEDKIGYEDALTQTLHNQVEFSSNDPYFEEKEVILPLSNGTNSVKCRLTAGTETDSSGIEMHYLVFEYKALSFTTQKYRLLDQAYYELLTKLKSNGLTIISCGSCAYFHRPSSVEGFCGFCLFGKEGQNLLPERDSVAVITHSCTSYTDMDQRESVLKLWRDSLQHLSLK